MNGPHIRSQSGGYDLVVIPNFWRGQHDKWRRTSQIKGIEAIVHKHQIDVLAFAEHNTSWDVTLPNLCLPLLFTKGWWENVQWTISYNRNQLNPICHQPGGTGILVPNTLLHRALRPGEDPLQLGRWCWTRFWGQHGQHLRVVSLYRLCYASSPLSTYQQQIRQLAKLNHADCPCMGVITELIHNITMWQEEGGAIIVLTDFNNNVRGYRLKNSMQSDWLKQSLTYMTAGRQTHTKAVACQSMAFSFLHNWLIITKEATWHLAMGYQATTMPFGWMYLKPWYVHLL